MSILRHPIDNMDIVNLNNEQQCDIYDAICSNSPDKLKTALLSIDPHTCEPGMHFPHYPYLLLFPETEIEYRERLMHLKFGARKENTTIFVSFLYIAIRTLARYQVNSSSWNLGLLKMLMSYHLKFAHISTWSNVNTIIQDGVVFQITTYDFLDCASLVDVIEKVKPSNSMHPQISVSIKKLQMSYVEGFEKDMKERLLQVSRSKSADIPTKMIPESVYKTLESLLFSEKVSDVIFEVNDESVSPPCITMLHHSLI